MSGAGGGGGTLSNPYLELWRGGAATPVITDDDSGPGNDAILSNIPIETAGTYYIRAKASGTQFGTYKLGAYLQNAGARPQTGGGNPPVEASPNETLTSAQDVSAWWRQAQYVSETTGTLLPGVPGNPPVPP